MQKEQQSLETPPAAIVGSIAGAINIVSKPLAACFAKHLFLTPRKYRLKDSELAFIEGGVSFSVPVGKHEVEVIRWGNGPAVLVCHGWAGHAAQFHKIASELLASGYAVVGINFPGHGNSPAKYPSLFDFVATVKKTAEVYGPFKAVIGHSIGALAAAFAESEKSMTEKLVLVGSLPSAVEALDAFSKMTGISSKILQQMRSKIEKKYGKNFVDYDFKNISKGVSASTLVIHDKKDRWTSWDATNDWVADSDADLISTEGLGHSRILEDAEVISNISDFLGPARGNIRDQFLSEFAL